MVEAAETSDNTEKASTSTKPIKAPKRGIIYLSTIPPYMNVTKIREVFGEFGKVGRIYLQLAETDSTNNKKSKQKKVAKKFTEGWLEFERKSVAKKVAQLLNNTQVSTRKKSKQFDCIWNIKYLSNFKWTHLHERLAYEKAARRQKLRTEIQLAKKKTNFFTANLDKRKSKEVVNKEFSNLDDSEPSSMDTNQEDRTEFLQSLFT
jgi:ESF2/ABP1 family protein